MCCCLEGRAGGAQEEAGWGARRATQQIGGGSVQVGRGPAPSLLPVPRTALAGRGSATTGSLPSGSL